MALLFDNANNDYLTVSAAPVAAVPLTMSIWFWPDEDDYNFQRLLSLADSGSSTDYIDFQLLTGLANDPLRTYTRAGATNVNANITGTKMNAWNHAAGVHASTSSRIVFLNGNKSSENTTTASPSAFDRLRIAVAAQSGGVSSIDFSGRLAEAAVWNVALADWEIANLNRGYSPLLVRPQSLKFYAPLIDDRYMDVVGRLKLSANGSPTLIAHPPMIYPPRRRLVVPAPAAPGVLSIPVAMRTYRNRRVA